MFTLSPRVFVLLILAAGSRPGKIDAGTEVRDAGAADPLLTLSWTGGARIKARLATDAAGGEQFLGWYDSKLKVDCELLSATDGAVRCIPRERISLIDGLFSDRACTRPALQRLEVGLGGCSSAPRYSPTIDLSCPGRFRVFEVGEPLHPQQLFERNDGKRCEEFATDNRPPVYARGREVKASELVAVTARAPRGDAGVGAVALELADGARGWRLHDLAGGFECKANLSSDGVTRCLPWEVVAPNGAQWGCTPRFGVESSRSGCGTTPLLERGQTYEWDYFELAKPRDGGGAAPVPRSRFPSAPEHGARAPAQSRLEPLVASWSREVSTFSGWRDSALATRCMAERASDGTLRCVPLTSTAVTGLYADATCTARLALAPTGDCAPRLALQYVDGCDVRARVFRVGARHTGPVYSPAFGVGCRSMTDARAFYRLGAEVPPEAMAPLTEVLR